MNLQMIIKREISIREEDEVKRIVLGRRLFQIPVQYNNTFNLLST